MAIASAILICDQVVKAVARSALQLGQPVPLIPGLVRLVMVHNTGAAFGLFQGGRPVFVLTSLLVLFVIAAYWRRVRPSAWPVVIALALIAGGSIGNLIDRALVGQVTDFFEFTFVEFPVFNVADMAIVCGVALLMVWVLFGPQPAETPAEELEQPAEILGASEDHAAHVEAVKDDDEPLAESAPDASGTADVPEPSVRASDHEELAG
ncbi:MAG: signal peptidase II [Coriobacteriia bacterium]|nr:signal peptidase II [Coriobacteriia bacterium]